MLCKNFKFLKYFIVFPIIFFPENGFDISCKLSALETVYMNSQNLFSSKNKKLKIINLSSAE